MRFELKPPANPRFEVSRMMAARCGPPLEGGAGCRSKGNRSARSGVKRSAMTSRRASAYGRAPTTRSCARFNLDVATSSIVRVILRVFWTERIRPLSCRLLAMLGREHRLERGECGLEPVGQVVIQRLLGPDVSQHCRVAGLEIIQEVLFPLPDVRHVHVIQVAV